MKYKCSICNYIYDEEEEGSFSELDVCPICKAPHDMLKPLVEEDELESKIYKCVICGYVHNTSINGPLEKLKNCPICKQDLSNLKLVKNTISLKKYSQESLDYDKDYAREDENERYMAEIHQMAISGKSIVATMSTNMKMPNWDDILILGAQLNPAPLDADAKVSTKTIIGKNAEKPLILENPVFISHMSFGALSRETKIALAKGSAMAKTATCSGEGGILPEEMDYAYKYIFEYVPNKYSVTSENLKNVDAIEIKIGQGTKPGMGGQLPSSKVTSEIAKIRDKPEGKHITSPSKFSEINSKDDLKEMVNRLREESEGRPIGIKIAAGRIEKDLQYCVYAKPDFITIDGRGGATGDSPKLLRDATSVPTIYALYRARAYLNKVKSDASLIITGGLRVSSDFAKALALGADAIAIASAGLIAAGCQQYRICDSGNCPMGVATQNEELRSRLKIDVAAQRVANFLNVSCEELKMFGRITGHEDIHDLDINDLITINKEISEFTKIKHA